MSQRVRLDLNSPVFQADFVRLDINELKQVTKTLRKLLEMTWEQVYRDTGLKWEEIKSDKGTYTLRISQQCRAVALREGDFLRLLSLHPDHDRAYRKK